MISNFIKIIHVNAQSLANVKHNLAFRTLLLKKCVDIIFVSESWFNEKTISYFSEIDGYVCIRNDRQNKGGGGGVCVFVKVNASYKVLAQSTGIFNNKPEYLIVEIIFKNVKLLCAVIYRRPGAEFLNDFFCNFYTFAAQYDDCFVCGDLNIDLNNESKSKKLLISSFEDCSMTPLPIMNTHVTQTSQTTLDVMFVSDNNIDETTCGQLDLPELSNHDLIYALLPICTNLDKNDVITHRDYKNINVELLIEDAINTPWHEITNFEDIDIKVEIFNKQLIELFNKHAPFKSFIKKNQENRWINNDIKDATKKRNKLKSKFKISKATYDFVMFKVMRNRVKQMIRSAYRKFLHMVVSMSQNVKSLWFNLKKYGFVVEKKKKIVVSFPPEELLNQFTLNVETNYEQFNDTFVSLNENEKFKRNEKFHFQNVTPLMVKSSILSIKSHAVGVDNISIKMLLPIIDISYFHPLLIFTMFACNVEFFLLNGKKH
jgi:hypothetical protein